MNEKKSFELVMKDETGKWVPVEVYIDEENMNILRDKINQEENIEQIKKERDFYKRIFEESLDLYSKFIDSVQTVNWNAVGNTKFENRPLEDFDLIDSNLTVKNSTSIKTLKRAVQEFNEFNKKE